VTTVNTKKEWQVVIVAIKSRKIAAVLPIII